MSRENISHMGFVGFEFHVTFEARNGSRTYSYDPVSGADIAAGADPNNYAGVEVSALDSAGNLAEALEEFGEIAEIAAL
jgi:hypothetical protein